MLNYSVAELRETMNFTNFTIFYKEQRFEDLKDFEPTGE